MVTAPRAEAAGPGPDDASALFALVDEQIEQRGKAADPSASWRVTACDHGRGPWDHGYLHGGPIGGLAGWAAERLVPADSGLMCARLTVEMLSAVPRAELKVSATVVKPGRRARLVDVAIAHDGRLVARATSQWVLSGQGSESPHDGPPARPTEVADPGGSDFDYPRPGFNCDAAELRFVSGSSEESGPATVWTRLTSPLMAGEETSPFGRAATVADLAAAAGWESAPDGSSYINPDITLQLARYPVGPWLALAARTQRSGQGAGYIDAVVHDDEGPIGRILQSLVGTGITL